MSQSTYAPLLTKGIDKHREIEGKRIPKVWPQIFHKVSTDSRIYIEQSWIMPGPPVERIPGEAFTQDSINYDWVKQFVISNFGKEFATPAEDIADDEYGLLGRWTARTGGMLAAIYAAHEEWSMANYLAVTAFTATSPAPGAHDGVALASASHPISRINTTDLYSTLVSGTNVALSMAGLQAARAVLDQQFMSNNYNIQMNRLAKLIVNPNLAEIANQLQSSRFTSADQQTNTLAGKFDVIEWAYFRKDGTTSAAGSFNGWVALGDTHPLLMIEREGVQTNSWHDGHTNSMLSSSSKRFTYGHTSDARGVVFSPGP